MTDHRENSRLVTAGRCLDGIFEGRVVGIEPAQMLSPRDYLKFTIVCDDPSHSHYGAKAVYRGMRDLNDRLLFEPANIVLLVQGEGTDPRADETVSEPVKAEPLLVPIGG